MTLAELSGVDPFDNDLHISDWKDCTLLKEYNLSYDAEKNSVDIKAVVRHKPSGKLYEFEYTQYNYSGNDLEGTTQATEYKPKPDMFILKTLLSDPKFIQNVCLSYDHSFGLMSQKEQDSLMFQCKEWFRAILNNAAVL